MKKVHSDLKCSGYTKLCASQCPCMMDVVAEAVKVLKMLENTSTPAAKKRMLMKSTFGDYRKKMADELREIDCGLFVYTF